MKGVKRSRRKVTQEQVDAMNRELELRHAGYRYDMDHNKRLTTRDVSFYDTLGCYESEERRNDACHH